MLYKKIFICYSVVEILLILFFWSFLFIPNIIKYESSIFICTLFILLITNYVFAFSLKIILKHKYFLLGYTIVFLIGSIMIYYLELKNILGIIFIVILISYRDILVITFRK